MKKQFEKNIELLKNISGFIKEKITFLDTIDIENTEMFRKSGENLEFLFDGQYYKINSIQSEEEVEFMTRGLQEKKDYLVVVLTVGNVPLLHKIMELVTKDSRIIVYEPNPYLLKYTLEKEDLSFLLKSNQATLIFDYDDMSKLEYEILSYSTLQWENLVKNLQIISPPNLWYYKEKCHHVIKKFMENFRLMITILGNSLEDIFEGQENCYKNVDAIIENCDLKEIKDKFKGYPAIVVASGPSLDKNIDILHKAQDKALIFSCDASMEACRQNQVKPDAVASIERVQATYQFYYEGKNFDEELVLIGPEVLWPKIFEEFPGKKLITNKVDSGAEKWWSDNFENCYHLGQGMSCANVAFAYAQYAGCNPIILIGQDLAYTENKIHSDLTHTKFEGENKRKDTKKELPQVEDINGDMIFTSDVYNMFRRWFEIEIQKDKDLVVIDATEGGARIAGAEIKTLQEVIDEYCVKEIPMHLYDCLSEQPKPETEVYIKKYEQIIQAAEEQKERLKKLKDKAEEHYRILEEIYYNEDLEVMSKEELVKIVIKLQQGDNVIESIKKEKYLITYFQQMIRQTVIFVKSLGNEITPENIKQNIRFQANLMGIIKNGSDVISAEYDKMIKFLEEKKEKREAEKSL